MPWLHDLSRGRARLRDSWSSIALAAIAAAIAWYIAHQLLGHPQPFFAPIAAAISISTSRIQRSRRIVQMIVGVLLGILIGEAGAALLGTSMGALALIVFVTMAVAVLSGVGFVGEGLLFANQAAASAILVVTLHRHGTGSERALDAVIGGAVALVLGVLLFPAQPLSMLYAAERDVLRRLRDALARCAFHAEETQDQRFLLTTGHDIHQQLAALGRARATARANVRVAPRRWQLRARVDAENERTAQLHLLANDVLGLVRSAAFAPRPLPDGLEQEIVALRAAIDRLAASGQPWSADVRSQVAQIAAELRAYAEREPRSTAAAILGASAEDLTLLLDPPAGRSAAGVNGVTPGGAPARDATMAKS